MSITIKTFLSGEIDSRRFQMTHTANTSLYPSLLNLVSNTYQKYVLSDFHLNYTDPDGDLCSILNEGELREAIRCAEKEKKPLD